MRHGLERYLRPGPDADRLVGAMAQGHARAKHGAELNAHSPDAFAALVRSHLRKSAVAVAVADERGRPRYLLADRETDQVAWITPHREHRSTLFSPRRGVDHYLRSQRGQSPGERWRPLDLTAVRAGPTRTATRTIASAQRHPPGPGRSLG